MHKMHCTEWRSESWIKMYWRSTVYQNKFQIQPRLCVRIGMEKNISLSIICICIDRLQVLYVHDKSMENHSHRQVHENEEGTVERPVQYR